MTEQQVSVYDRLSAPFAVSEHATVNKGGGDQTYAPWTEYVERLNTELGFENWSFRVVREGFTETECWVLGEITATVNGVTTTRQQYGCEPITKGRDAKPTTDLLKSTASDALKKAASLIGPGLYLSVKEERVAIQAAMRAEVQAAAKAEADARSAKAQAERDARQKTVAPTPINDVVRDAAVLTGASPKAEDVMTCIACQKAVQTDSVLDIQRNERGARTQVSLADFAPVCIERLGGFHCGPCYDQKFWQQRSA